MRRQLISLIGVLIFSSAAAVDLGEKLHQQLGPEGYFYGPTKPEMAMVIDQSRKGRYIVCLSEDQKESFIYEVTETFFPKGAGSVFVRCNQGTLIVSKS